MVNFSTHFQMTPLLIIIRLQTSKSKTQHHTDVQSTRVSGSKNWKFSVTKLSRAWFLIIFYHALLFCNHIWVAYFKILTTQSTMIFNVLYTAYINKKQSISYFCSLKETYNGCWRGFHQNWRTWLGAMEVLVYSKHF